MNITWKIINIEWIESLGTHSKIIKNVHYWVDCVDSDGDMGYTWGNVQLNTDNITSFLEFDSLTEDVVLGWAKAALDGLYGTPERSGTGIMEQNAIDMCLEKDPSRKRGFGVPW